MNGEDHDDGNDGAGRFDDLDELGSGGMSTVYRVYDRVLARETAQKVLRPRYHRSDRHVRRFTAEAQTTGQLEHPNIVPVHDFGQDPAGDYFINMKLVHGSTLRELADDAGDQRLDPERMREHVQIVTRVCDALAFAHSRGFVHRDIKPSNIMVGPFGEVYLMDWGVAVRPDDANTDEMTGTPAFMAPEQIRGESLDPRTDVFAVGATLYYCVTGQPPYPGPGVIQAMAAAADARWEPIEALVGDRAPPGIDAIVHKAMARDREDRYADIRELKRDLEEWVRGRWHLPVRRYSAGDIVVREGDEGHEAFLIVAGTVEVRKHLGGRDKIVAELGPGEVFGEMAIFSDHDRTGTVIAKTDLELQVVTRKTLTAATGLDSWVGQFITAVAERFLAAERRVHQLERLNTQDDPDESDGS